MPHPHDNVPVPESLNLTPVQWITNDKRWIVSNGGKTLSLDDIKTGMVYYPFKTIDAAIEKAMEIVRSEK